VKSSWLDIVSGTEQGVGASVARVFLRALSVPYAAAVRGRKWLYDAAVLRPARAPIPVVSVGNITAGGTGKTPLVEYLVRGLAEQGLRPSVVMRGYGARRGGTSDEAALLRANLGRDVPVVEETDRHLGALRAAREFKADVAILDDGFQHLALARDLDVVTVDATCPFGFGRLLPAGCLRERPESLARADAIVLTRTDLPPHEELSAIRRRVGELAPGALVAESVYEPSALEGAAGRRPVGEIHRRRVAAFCGIGNPYAFGLAIRRLGAEVVFARRFPDHHPFSAAELDAVAREAGAREAVAVVTTQKDAERIADGMWPEAAPPLLVLRAEFAVRVGEEALWERIDEALECAAGGDGARRTGGDDEHSSDGPPRLRMVK